jgi:hypothetical protein
MFSDDDDVNGTPVIVAKKKLVVPICDGATADDAPADDDTRKRQLVAEPPGAWQSTVHLRSLGDVRNDGVCIITLQTFSCVVERVVGWTQ